MFEPSGADTVRFHAVKFYESRESLSHLVAEFLSEGLAAHEGALVIATLEHREDILSELHARGFDAEGMQTRGDLSMLDASDVLAQIMIDGMPDAGRFNTTTSRAIERVGGRPGHAIRAYGEMVDVLWKQRHDAAAIRLEMLWNKLASTQEFKLLCGYSMGNCYKNAGLAAIHHQHTHVVSASGVAESARHILKDRV